jgi:hypothetical protein
MRDLVVSTQVFEFFLGLEKDGWSCSLEKGKGSATLPSERGAVSPASTLVDFRGAAALLGLSVPQVRGLQARGELLKVRIGKKFYFNRASLLRWAQRAEKDSTASC